MDTVNISRNLLTSSYNILLQYEFHQITDVSHSDNYLI